MQKKELLKKLQLKNDCKFIQLLDKLNASLTPDNPGVTLIQSQQYKTLQLAFNDMQSILNTLDNDTPLYTTSQELTETEDKQYYFEIAFRQTQPNQLDYLNPHFKSGLGDLLHDPITLDTDFEKTKISLKTQYPNFTNYQLNYWAAKITIFNYANDPDTFILQTSRDEPSQIILTLNCTYLS